MKRFVRFLTSCSFQFLSVVILCLVGSADLSALRKDTFIKKEKCVRGCLNWGFFAEFFWTLNHLQYCREANKIPVIYWDETFAYYSKEGYNGSQNCWEYYFEPVSKMKYNAGDQIHRDYVYDPNFSSVWWYTQYIDNLHLLPPEERKDVKALPLPPAKVDSYLYPVGKDHLYSKAFRNYVKTKLLDRYVQIKPAIMEKINSFYSANMQGNRVIGIHLRGKFGFNEVGVIPIDLICKEANQHADDNTVFLVATDQVPLLEEAKRVLKGRVIYYECYRQAISTNPSASGQCPPQMGEDVLIETVLLSRCDHFVHTISNVSTAVLYFNPELAHTALYCGGE